MTFSPGPPQPPPSQLSPHRARPVRLDSPYGPLAALRETPSNPRATVVLIPGYTGSKEDFAPLLDAIAEAGFDVIAPDLPGQHESPGPADEQAYVPDALGKVVADVIRSLGSRVILLGHSYGGLVARGAVLAGAPVIGLTLMDSGPARLPDGVRMDTMNDGEPVLRREGIEAAYAVRERMSALNPGWAALPASLKAFFRQRFVASVPECLLGMAAGLRSEPDRVDELAATLSAGAIPASVVAGAGDDAWSVSAQRSMAGRLGASFSVVPDAWHSPNTENPSGLLAVLLPVWRSWT